jgi:hypothetical protein
MEIHEAITEAHENVTGNLATEPCVVRALLSEIYRCHAELFSAQFLSEAARKLQGDELALVRNTRDAANRLNPLRFGAKNAEPKFTL